MKNISVIIVAHNHTPYLVDCIKSVHNFAQEIIVVDIGMTQEMKRRAQELDVKIVSLDENVPYVELIREKSKEYANSDYILFLDPDEELTEDLKPILKEATDRNDDYVKIPRKNIIMGKWIENSRWWPDYQVRFFKKDSVRWPTQIHKQPEISGSGYTVEPKESFAIIHHNYESLDEYMQKALRYAKAEASEKKEYSLHQAISNALSEFFSRFFADNGYKDGMHGFVLAFLQMFYSFLVFFYYWENKRYFTVDEKEIVKETNEYFNSGLKQYFHWINVRNFSLSKIKDKVKKKILDL